MSIYHPVSEVIRCDSCNESAEYQCDLCAANYCVDCQPDYDDEDCPADVCESCATQPEQKVSKP